MTTESYIDRIRKLVGKRALILPAARAVIQDRQGRVLLIRRRDNLRWALPAGGIEVGESMFDCLVREVKEETGLDVMAATPIALHSEPGFGGRDALGDEYQLLVVVFRVDEWGGELVRETEETVDAGFFSLDDAPELSAGQLETLEDWRGYEGEFILK